MTTTGEPIINVEGLTKHFPVDSGFISGLTGTDVVQAVDDVSFELRAGETFALVGESGCGKTTLARAMLQLEQATEGSVIYEGRDLTEIANGGMRASVRGLVQRLGQLVGHDATSADPVSIRPLRRNLQMIFQDPQSSLDPRMKVGPIVEEPMKAHGLYTTERREAEAKRLLELVGLDDSHYYRYPHEFSGGQRQRINLARALSTEPDVILCDEPVSALDVTIQAQVLNTMQELQDEFEVTYLFITHDLSVVRYIADRVAVMYLGHLVELADKEELFEHPKHPYTEALLSSIPVPDPRKRGATAAVQGDVPSPINPPSGCRFRTRCPELIQPGTFDDEPDHPDRLDAYGMDDHVWDAVVRFMRAVRRSSFNLDGIDDTEGFVEDEFFEAGRPEGPANAVVQEAIEDLDLGNWDDAADRLTAAFEAPSICARERPVYTVEAIRGDAEYLAACHHHRRTD